MTEQHKGENLMQLLKPPNRNEGGPGSVFLIITILSLLKKMYLSSCDLVTFRNGETSCFSSDMMIVLDPSDLRRCF